MSMPEMLGLVLGSAAVGALVSSIVSGIFSWKIKVHELERQDMEMALRFMEASGLVASREAAPGPRGGRGKVVWWWVR